MTLLTVDGVQRGKTNLDNLEIAVNSTQDTYTTPDSVLKPTLNAILSRAAQGDISQYSAAATYTEIDDWVEFGSAIFRPIPSYLPIGPEAFDSSKWTLAQVKGVVPIDTIADLRLYEPLYDGQAVDVSAHTGGYSATASGIPKGGGKYIASGKDHSAVIAALDALGVSGVYVPFPSDPTGASGAWVLRCDFTLTPYYLGAQGDWDDTALSGTDDTLAFEGLQAIVNETAVQAEASSLYFPIYKVKAIGQFLVSRPIINLDKNNKGLRGYTFQGGGRGTTKFAFRPAQAGESFIYIYDGSFRGSFSGFSVQSFGTNSATGMFLYCYALDVVSGNLINDVEVRGPLWYSGAVIEAPNLGSEWTFRNVSWSNQLRFASGLNGLPATNPMSYGAALWVKQPPSTDQAVNYIWDNVDCGVIVGHGVRLDKGGNFHWRGGTVTAYSARTTQGYLFCAPTGDHDNGCQNMTIENIRFEPYLHGLQGWIYCRWKAGTIKVQGVTDDATAYDPSHSPDFEFVDIGCENASGPSVTFESSTLVGSHRYSPSGSSSWTSRDAGVVYRNCKIVDHESLDTFIKTDITGLNGSTAPIIKADDTTFKPSAITSRHATQVQDQVLNWNRGYTLGNCAATVAYTAFDGKSFPVDSGDNMLFHKNTFIKSLTVYIEPGQFSYTGAATITLQTNEVSPTVLATVSIANLSLGHAETVAINKMLIDDDVRSVKILSNIGVGTRPADIGRCACIIDYCG